MFSHLQLKEPPHLYFKLNFFRKAFELTQYLPQFVGNSSVQRTFSFCAITSTPNYY